jgi:copper homeostasis protein
MKLEIIGFNIDSCIKAQQAGANRIELCDNPAEGGTTPSYGFINAARKKLSIELYIMIRPRGGDFLYSDEEFDIMKADITLCKQAGCDGIVTGILNADGTIDKKRNSALVDYAYPLGLTFHRAFDRAKDPFQSLEDIIEIGCERILTSGQQKKATEGIPLIKNLVQRSGERIIIMPGSGVNTENIIHIAETTGATEFHSSASIYSGNKMEYLSKIPGEEMAQITVDRNEVTNMATLLKKLSNASG